MLNSSGTVPKPAGRMNEARKPFVNKNALPKKPPRSNRARVAPVRDEDWIRWLGSGKVVHPRIVTFEMHPNYKRP